MASRKVLITDHPWTELDIESKILSEESLEIVDAPDDSEETLANLAEDVIAIATCWGQVTKTVIESASDCRLICRMGIGLDNIDVDFATSQGITVTNIPDYCIPEVADHTLALLLAIERNAAFFHLRTKRGEYDLASGPPMKRLAGRRLGLIGFGRIGQAVRARAESFGLEVVAYTPSGNDYGTGCTMVSLEEVLATSEYISLHVPLKDDTQNIIDSQAISAMKPGAVLINTSRGGLVDPEALLQGLKSGKLSGAGLDVFSPEPPDITDELYQREDVVATPHAAFVSEEALIELRERVAHQIVAMVRGEQPENIVNAVPIGS
ncbi:C-terminal binding protein [Thalassoglobus sp. JC818]|uniref:C-terminal binding protein n=1 Tax=Thalassoglobus sp. JC818 TaxID=3232136 RepID=UPI00345A3E23